ncbi:ferredoxin reductase-like C-terminal NADP-linked domain-containing protein [Mycena amicta]|nr:ferredoxin reductase-like C-terminal NADP-linked domain-containing protein [Mycena amicta]
MPNRNQLAFLLSLTLPFALLLSLDHFFLKTARYNLSQLILIGLDDNMSLHAVDLPFFGTQDLVAVASSPAFIVSGGLVLATILYFNYPIRRVFNAVPLGSRKVLDPKIWQEFPLEKKTQISPNTAIYRFSLPRPTDVLGLPVGKHISVSAILDGKQVSRSYTPISSDEQKGSFDLVIKSYEKGNISRHFTTLKLGDTLSVKGPRGAFDYKPGLTAAIGMIAGGSWHHPNPHLRQPHGDHFTVFYVLNNPPAGWTGGVGFVTKEQIRTHLPPSTDDAKILMCGPPPMLKAMNAHLDALQWPAPRTVSKLADKVFCF